MALAPQTSINPPLWGFATARAPRADASPATADCRPNWPQTGLFRRRCRWFRLAEARGVGAVDQGFGTLARQVFEPIDTGVDIVFPHLARHLVEELDAVAVRVVDVDAVRHAMVDAPIEFDAAALQEGELLQPCLAVRHGQRDMVDRDLAVGQHPI